MMDENKTVKRCLTLSVRDPILDVSLTSEIDHRTEKTEMYNDKHLAKYFHFSFSWDGDFRHNYHVSVN